MKDGRAIGRFLIKCAVEGQFEGAVIKQEGSDKGERHVSTTFNQLSQINPPRTEDVPFIRKKLSSNYGAAFDYRTERSPEQDAETSRGYTNRDPKKEDVDSVWREHESYKSDKDITEVAQPGPAVT